MYDAFYIEGTVKLLLEFMDCGSLEDVLKISNKIPETVLAKITKQICLGLNYLHTTTGVVHRDIKPANILINSNGEVKIADFGLVGQKKGDNKQSWETYCGTGIYMSPERIAGQSHSYDSDVWSLGLVIAHLAIGKYPLEIKGMSIWDNSISIEDKSKILKILPENEFSSEMIKFVNDCLKFERSERPKALELLNYDWIVKNENTQPSIKKFIHYNYVEPKKKN